MQFDSGTANRYTYTYNANGQAVKVTDSVLNRTAISEYDLANRPACVIRREGNTHLYTGEVGYDGHNNLSAFREQVGSGRTVYNTTFSYDSAERPTTVQYANANNKVAYTYDSVGRITKRKLTTGGTAVDTDYTYVSGGYVWENRI